MEIIPEEWSVRLISPFLIGLSRDSLHTSRNTKLRKNLMRAENIKVAGYVCAGGGSDEDGNGGKDDDNGGDKMIMVMMKMIMVMKMMMIMVVMMMMVVMIMDATFLSHFIFHNIDEARLYILYN